MDFRLLGPLEVVGDGGLELAIGTGRQRALLAVLILRANELVASDRLVEELWGETPPPTAHKMLHNQVSALRQALGRDGRLETHGSAYRLKVGSGELDVDRFEDLLAQARGLLDADPERALARLVQALELWRGPALSDLAYEPFAQTEIARLEERRWVAFEAKVEAELALGRHADVVAELEAAVAEQPLREHLHAQLMLALYRCGRQAEALEAFRRARATLVEQIGVEPGTELRSLQDAILAHDPALDAPAGPEELPAALLGGSSLLAGRDPELAELVGLLADAGEGRGGVVLVSGPTGIGKTRLAGELAREALRRRMTVLYVGAATPPAEALAAVQRGDDHERPTLLIVDDADDARPDVLDRVAALGADSAARPLLLLALHRLPEPPLPLAAHPARRLRLPPLEKEAVGAIARLYLPAGETIPIERLATQTAGVPLAVHRAAAEWARVRASEVIGASADRAAAERGELRAAEADLLDDLLALRTVDERGRVYEHEEAPLPVICPFPGLSPFDAAHAEYFFGRERLVAELVARLVGSAMLAVVGPSGSGKSSVVRAGLLPALASGVLPGSERWQLALMRPGEHPLGELQHALPEPGEQAVLVVDQFEELFTVCRDERERVELLDALVEAAEDRARRIQVVVAIRADFYGHCAVHERLARLVGANQVLVGPMRRDELRRAIEEPARRVGLQVEPSLTDALIADVLDKPGGLPLLSAALLEQWREREGRVMRRAAYERTGGVEGAVGRLAEQTYARLSEPERLAARRILLRLAGAGEQETAFVRRRMPLDELDAQRDEHTEAALAALVDSRLVTADEETLEVAHEALLREWPRLRAWLEEDAEGRRLHQHLIHAARDWEAAGRDPGELYRGARLAAALDWSAAHGPELNASERAFLEDSRAASERSHRRLRATLAGVALLLALSVIAGIVALEQRGSAREQAVAADAQRLGARALAEDDLDRALLLARQGVALDDSVQTRGNLLAALLKAPAALGILRGDDEPITAVELSPDERILAAGTNSNEVFLFDTRTRRRLATLKPASGYAFVGFLAFSPDARRLAVGYDSGQGGVVAVFDVRSRRVVARMSPPPGRLLSGLGYSPDGRTLDVILARAFVSRGPAVLMRFDARTGVRRFGPVPVNRAGSTSLMITSDGRRLVAVGESETVVRDARNLRVLERWPVGGQGASQFWPTALSPDDRTVAIGGEDGSVRLLDLQTGEQRRALGRHVAEVFGARFTPDGRTLVTTGADSDVILWDVRRATAVETLSGQPGRVLSPEITGDGRTLYTAGPGAAVFIWDLFGARRLGRPFATGAPSSQPGLAAVRPGQALLALSSDGDLIARGQDDGAVSIVDAHTLARRQPFPVITTGPVHGLGFVPGSHRLVVSGPAGFLAVADADRGRLLERLPGHRGNVLPPAISADGRRLVTGSHDATVRLWSLPGGRPLGDPLRFSRVVDDVQVSPDGRWVTVVLVDTLVDTSGVNGTLEVWDARRRRRVARLGVPDTPTAVRFSPDGRLLAVGYPNGRSHLWSTQDWKPVTRLLRGDVGDIYAVAVSPDGRTLATGSLDRTVRLWDIETQQAIGTPLPGPGRGVGAVAPYFTPDGAALIASYDTGRAYRWEIRPGSLARHACQVAGRRLTRAEWAEFLPGRDYDPAC